MTPNWPVGLGYIAESLRRADIEYKVCDLRFREEKKSFLKDIAAFNPDIVGLSLMTSKYRHHYQVIREIKSSFPQIDIVVGGPHVSLLKEKVLLDCRDIDYGITLEGEETILELCNGKEHKDIKGLLYRGNDKVLYTGDRNYIHDIDSINYPSYDKFKIDKYDTKSINIVSSRGCPYNCIYCCVKRVVGRKWRGRSYQNVVDEIEYWYKKGYRVFNFSDDCFNLDKERLYSICSEIEKRGLDIELNCPNGIRADRVDRQLLERMREIGFRHLAFGVEGGNNKVLKNIKKGESIEDIEEGIKNASELGYDMELFFLIGSPGEDEKDIEDSFRLAAKYPLRDVRFYNLIPFPNTELYDWIEENNYFVVNKEDYLNGNLMWVNEPIFQTPELSLHQRKKIYKRGIRLGNRLRRKYMYEYYVKSFRKLGVFASLIGYLASRNTAQSLLKRSGLLQKTRLLLKKAGIFERCIRQ
ncbi:MAG: radical SAM protein [Nitrospirae bacterium]|nr:radical SAM protein [Nitrospirota bacterium]